MSQSNAVESATEIPVVLNGQERRASLVRALIERKLRLHQLPGDLSAEEAASIRREALAHMTQTDLSEVGHFSFDAEQAASYNCENLIGVAQIPMGVAGPLPIRGSHVEDEVFVPLATTEGALIASINRGCTAIRAAGGAVVRVEDVGMTRAPVFTTSGIEATQRFLRWVEEHHAEIKQKAESTSRYLTLHEVRPFTFGTTVYLRFRFGSGDAMGMNMATIACNRVIEELIEPATGVSCISLSGNYCVDKKPAAINFQEGRGKRIFAEIVLDASMLARYLKTTAAAMVEVQYRKTLLGSIAAGSMAYNAHYANIVAALFVATGQDVAQVVEGSLGITCIEPRGEGGLYFSVFLPDAPVGAVGGGTSLTTQQAALGMMEVAVDAGRPGHAAMRLAEILGAVVLAGELSLMGALSSHHLASAHQQLARGGVVSRNGV